MVVSIRTVKRVRNIRCGKVYVSSRMGKALIAGTSAASFIAGANSALGTVSARARLANRADDERDGGAEPRHEVGRRSVAGQRLRRTLRGW